MGTANHLRPPPGGAISHAHLAAAVLRTGRHRSAVHHVARSEHDRHGDREGPRGARPGRRDAHGHGVRCLVSGVRRLRTEFQEHRRLLDRNRAVSVRNAARILDQRLPAEHARPASAEPVLEPLAAGSVAAPGRGGLHGNGVDGGARVRVEVQRVAAVQSLQVGRRPDRPRRPQGAICLLRSPGSTRSRGRRGVGSAPGLRRVAHLPARGHGHYGRRHPRRRHMGDSHRPGIRGDGPRSARRAEVSGPPSIPRWSAGAAVRRGRLVAAAADGRSCRGRRCAAVRRGPADHETRRLDARREGETDAVRGGAQERRRAV